MQLFNCCFALAALFAGNVFAQNSNSRVKPGGCPSVPPMQEFDKTKFVGRWYEVERSPSIFDFIMRCLAVDYLTIDNDPNLDVIVRGNAVGGLPITIKGDGMRPPTGTTSQPGKYTVRFGFGVPFQGTEMTVLDTDYEEYALIYACTNSILPKLFHTQFLWIMSRDGTLSNPTRQNLYELLDGHKINRVSLQLSERSQCPQNTTFNRESEQNLAQDGNQVELDTVSSALPSAQTTNDETPGVKAEPQEKVIVEEVKPVVKAEVPVSAPVPSALPVPTEAKPQPEVPSTPAQN